MTMQMPKWKTYTMESYEIPHIFKEPPKAVFTTKRDKISEADVQWMTRPDGQYSDITRINEKISVYPKGVDPVAKMKYGTNPYKLQVIRVPEVAAEQRVAISRPRLHQNKSVNSNPGIRESASAMDVANKIDLYNINKITSKERVLKQIRPTSSYRIDFLDPEVFRIDFQNKAINKDTDFYSVTSGKIMKITTDNDRTATNSRSITDKVSAQNVSAPFSSYTTNKNNEIYTSDKINDRQFIENVNSNYYINKHTSGSNDTYVDDKITDKLRIMNIQASFSRPTTEVITPDLNLVSKQDLQKIMSKQIFRKDDIMNSMDSGVTLMMKNNQVETNSNRTMKELNTPIMNTEVPMVSRVERESYNRSTGAIPNIGVRQELQTMKENNKGNLSFKMEMYNKDLFEC